MVLNNALEIINFVFSFSGCVSHKELDMNLDLDVHFSASMASFRSCFMFLETYRTAVHTVLPTKTRHVYTDISRTKNSIF